MRELFRTLPLMAAVLLVPVLPFLLFGGAFESWLRGFAESPPSFFLAGAAVAGLLASDIFLPIPSSIVCTFAGWQLGWAFGTLFAWLGLSAGAAFGFFVARRFGLPLARRFSRPEDLDRVRALTERYGPMVLVLTRAVPVFAEASVLMVGIHHLPWRRFLPPVFLSNLGIALAYAVFGDVAERHQWLPAALAVSIAVPPLVAFAAGRLLARPETPSQPEGMHPSPRKR